MKLEGQPLSTVHESEYVLLVLPCLQPTVRCHVQTVLYTSEQIRLAKFKCWLESTTPFSHVTKATIVPPNSNWLIPHVLFVDVVCCFITEHSPKWVRLEVNYSLLNAPCFFCIEDLTVKALMGLSEYTNLMVGDSTHFFTPNSIVHGLNMWMFYGPHPSLSP